MKNLSTKTLLFVIVAVSASLLLGGYTIIKDQRMSTDYLSVDADQFAYPMFTSYENDHAKEFFGLCSKGRYSKALELLENADVNVSDPRMKFAKGLCYLETQEFEKAEQLFNDIIKGGHPLIQHQTMWYLALVNIKRNNINGAQPYLEILAGQPTASFHVQACDLLKQLGSDESRNDFM